MNPNRDHEVRPQPLKTFTITFGALVLLFLGLIFIAPHAPSSAIFLSGSFAIFTSVVLYRVLKRGTIDRRLFVPLLVFNFAASALLAYLAGTYLAAALTA
jgi:uncharacterized membrane protein YfcA